ncbi:DNA mismatch repair protein [Lecanora helva]
MGDESRPILPLPPEVAAQIKSSTAIPSLINVALGLVENSLDAEASKITVNVDFIRGAVTVEDNGIGIPPKEFNDDGGLGKLHYTSKYGNSTALIGRNGSFLASVAALSILTITSHHRNHIHHASLILHHLRPAARLIPAPPQQHLFDRDHGTRVTVQDLFGNMPVRVKQREHDSQFEKKYENLRKQIAGLLLAWHIPVSVSLKVAGSKMELRVRGKESALQDERKRDSARSLDLSLVCGVLSQAGYLERSDWVHWIKTSARTPFITIKGAISLKPAPSKLVQFISLGFQPLIAGKCGNELYDEVNRLFASSSFGNQEVSDDEESSKARKREDRRFKKDGFTQKQLKGRGKGIDRWPMFYIRIEMQSLNRSGNDIGNLAEGTLTGLLKILGAMITGFLDEHHFRPRARARRHKSESTLKEVREDEMILGVKSNRPGEKLTKYQEHNFASWSRIKSGVCVKSSAASPTVSPCAGLSLEPRKDALEPSSACEIPQEGAESSESISEPLNEPSQTLSDNTVEWINSKTGAIVLVNARTGLVVNPQVHKRSTSAKSQILDHGTISSKRLTLPPASTSVDQNATAWSENLLREWKNPIFSTTEEPIPQISFDGPSLETSEILHGRHHRCSEKGIQNAFTQSSNLFSARLSRQGLKESRVVAQVDQKFILVSMPNHSIPDECEKEPRQLLVLIDQHAADERIRVEALLATLDSNPVSLAKPITIEISNHENELLTRQIPHFTSWGIIYTTTYLPSNPSKSTVTVSALPASIAERCRLEPKLLIDLLRGEAWRRHDLYLSNPPVPTPNPTSQTVTESWLTRLPTIPPTLLDMLNSRACRSAIMFNDVLSLTECATLVERLNECVFPFQCAHGRPSMVPVVDVGGEGTHGAGDDVDVDGGIGFGEAWGKWRGGSR